jgi:uncharacterized iron-regulated membrane protein
MHWLALLHRWAGGLVGLALAVIGLSGTVLVWEESWIALPGAHEPLRGNAAQIGAAVARAAQQGELSRVTFADERIGLHQALYADGGGAYLDQAGKVVDRWSDMWGRPELWLFDLHHYLFLGESGKYVTGTLGLLLLGFAISGLILWWRTRRTFRWRLWPRRMTRPAIVWHHRDLGLIASPLLLLAAVTGSLMIFKPLADTVLAPWTDDSQAAPAPPIAIGPLGKNTDWPRLMTNAQAAFPEAVPRRLMLPDDPDAPVTLRLRQPFEWTPQGRTYVYLDPESGDVLATDDPAVADTASAITEKFYPVHAGKVGGGLWRLALTFGGVALVLLGTLASWSFWFGNRANLPTR